MLVTREYQYGTFENIVKSSGSDIELGNGLRLDRAYDAIEKLEYRIVDLENKIKLLESHLPKQQY